MSRREQVYLSTNKLSFNNSLHYLFEDASLSLAAGEKVGLIGFNGCGKSTLLQLLARSVEPSSGQVIHANALRYYLVEQSFPSNLLSMTPKEALLDIFPEDERFTEGWRIWSILDKMDIRATQQGLSCSQLSGGEQTRILLARAQLYRPNVLLLDEPSNHLDLPTIIWLESFLKEWKASFILVSHDTRLLDNVTDSTWIIASGQIQRYQLPCTQALAEHQKMEQSCQQLNQEQASEIDRIESSARQLAVWGRDQHSKSSARKSQSMLKRIDKMKQAQTVLPDPYPWSLSFPGQTLPANRILACEYFDVTHAPHAPSLYILRDFMVKPGEKIALIGANGMGKSTFLQLVWQSFQQQGEMIKLHNTAVVAYYDQLQNGVESESELIDALRKYCDVSRVRLTNDEIIKALLGAGFPWEKLQSKVSTLSGGERARLMFAGISLVNSHLLLLDEPTNHLDITGKEALEEQLKEYKGTLILVSHDRDLIESTCSRFIVISGGRLHSLTDAEKAYDFSLKAGS